MSQAAGVGGPFAALTCRCCAERAETRRHHPFLSWARSSAVADLDLRRISRARRRAVCGLKARGVSPANHVLIHLDNFASRLSWPGSPRRTRRHCRHHHTRSAPAVDGIVAEHGGAVAAITHRLWQNHCHALPTVCAGLR